MCKKLRSAVPASLLATVLAAGLLIFGACEDLGNRALADGDAAVPEIIGQPEPEAMYTLQKLENETETIAALSVTASSTDNGVISYQWYAERWEIDRVAGDPPEITYEYDFPMSGATHSTFTPVLTNEDGDYEEGEYAFYAIVTNTNSGLAGKKTATLRSSTAYIFINDQDAAEYPAITVHPASKEEPYQLGPNMSITPLTVTAAVTDGGTLSYKWYRSMDNTSTNGTVALGSGGESASFTPDFSDTPGTYYYYVVVTNTTYDDPSDPEHSTVKSSRSRVSYPAKIVVIRVQTAVTPVITVQPKDASYLINDEIPVADLTVDNNTVSDGGNITYQWYSNTTASTSGATPIALATAKTLSPGISKATAGTYFYYVVVTNTNSSAVNETSTATSRIAMISVMSPPAAENATVTIDTATKYQYVRGFGGMSTPWDNAPDDTVRDVELMYSPEGLGYNIMRIMIMPTNTDINLTMQQLVNNELSGDRDRSDYYELVKIVNKHGGYVLASPWSPPADWKSNGSVNGGGYLLPQFYQRYADYLKAFCQHMWDQGAPIYAVSIQNEPNFKASYDGCEWEPEEMRDFLKQVGTFTTGVRGWGKGARTNRVLIMNGESANTTAINLPALADPDSRAVIDLLGRHVYGSQAINLWGNANMVNPNGTRKEVWMTEHNINTSSNPVGDSTWNLVWKFMNDVDLTIRLNNENAFIWWTQKRFYSMIGDGDYGTIDGRVTPRGYGLSQYAKFAKEMWRVDVAVSGTGNGGSPTLVDTPPAPGQSDTRNVNGSFSLDSTTVKITAFVSDDGNTISVVMYTPTNDTGGSGINMGNVKIQLPAGFAAQSAVAMRSTRTGDVNRFSEMEAVALSTDRNSAVVNLPDSHILSVRFTK